MQCFLPHAPLPLARPTASRSRTCAPLAPSRRLTSTRPLPLRAQQSDYDPPSDTTGPSRFTSPPNASTRSSRYALSLRLLELAALTSRGQNATPSQKAQVEELVAALEASNPNTAPVESPLIDGEWNLVYSSGAFYEANPFLLPAATPLLQVGQIRQIINVDAGELINETEVTAFPLISGKIVTSARVAPVGPDRLELTVAKTTLKGGSVAQKVDLGALSVDVPVEEIYQKIRGAAPETFLDTFYLDERLRISRSKGGKVFIFTKAEPAE